MKHMPDIQEGFPHTLYEKNKDIHICFSEDMGELAKEEAHHHDHDDEDPIEVHQLSAYRNTFYHERIWKQLHTLETGSHILEIGAGSGFDAQQLMHRYVVTISDVSPETLNRTHQKLGDKVNYVAADGEHLPFEDSVFDAVYMIAVFHHFESPQKALEECKRVLKQDGQLIIGIEPNSFYFKPMQYIQGALYRLTKTDPHHISKADQMMTGFSQRQLKDFLKSTNFSQIQIQPVWFISGWVHYALEFMFRAFSLKKRIVPPRFLEKMFVKLDEYIFSFALLRNLCWHWTTSGKKR